MPSVMARRAVKIARRDLSISTTAAGDFAHAVRGEGGPRGHYARTDRHRQAVSQSGRNAHPTVLRAFISQYRYASHLPNMAEAMARGSRAGHLPNSTAGKKSSRCPL